MTPLVSSLLGAGVRWVLVGLGAYFVAKGTLTADQADQLTSAQTVEQIVGGITMIAPLIYSLFAQPRHIREKMASGLVGPNATLSEIQVRAAMPDIRARDLQRS